MQDSTHVPVSPFLNNDIDNSHHRIKPLFVQFENIDHANRLHPVAKPNAEENSLNTFGFAHHLKLSHSLSRPHHWVANYHFAVAQKVPDSWLQIPITMILIGHLT